MSQEYTLASKSAMQHKLEGLHEYMYLYDCIGTYVKLAGTRATPEDVVIYLIPSWGLVSAFFADEQDAQKAWKELYEAQVIDEKTFQGENYDMESTQGEKLRVSLVKAQQVERYAPPEPTKGMTLDEYVDEFIRECREKTSPPPILQARDPSQIEFEANPNITWGNTRRGRDFRR
ncbi:hypothetical protein MGU_05755 [Metarhizium guizhouense ARSEF 977]|uniref:Uncharacterized protein n=1 Tax=Metarhizium guizhouense (strain ARSEF 977) TaxID=1276136 RepID=A0A0B4H4M9_METGA|nr:hypothetical protein MGU_05755 [Metarhizium guizhouense ARSEF 977]